MLQYVIVPGNNQHRANRKQFLAQGDNGDPDRLILKQNYKSNTLTTAQDHIYNYYSPCYGPWTYIIMQLLSELLYMLAHSISLHLLFT